MKRSKARSRFLFGCIAPAVILFFIFMILPTINVFRLSLFKLGAYSPVETFVGLDNYKVLFTDEKFIRSMQKALISDRREAIIKGSVIPSFSRCIKNGIKYEI